MYARSMPFNMGRPAGEWIAGVTWQTPGRKEDPANKVYWPENCITEFYARLPSPGNRTMGEHLYQVTLHLP